MQLKTPLFKNLITNLQVNVEIASHSKCWRNWREIDYVPSYNKLYFICSGEGWLKIGNTEFHPTVGQLILMPAGVTQSYSAINENTFTKYWCHFSAKVGETNLFDMIESPHFIDVKDIPRLECLFNDLIKNYLSNNFSSAFKVKSILLEILSYFIENTKIEDITLKHTKSSEILNAVIDHIENHLSENITVAELAQIAHFNPSYFIRFFKKNTGISPIHYLNQTRLEKAKKMLSYSDLNISEISEKIGFNDLFHFSKSFKNYTGFSPSEFKKIK